MDDKMDEVTFTSICKIMKSLDRIGSQMDIVSTNPRLQKQYLKVSTQLDAIMERYTAEEQKLVTKTYHQQALQETERLRKLREKKPNDKGNGLLN
jgi:hypothetical protein